MSSVGLCEIKTRSLKQGVTQQLLTGCVRLVKVENAA